MSGPSQYVREKREAASQRRLELAKLLRENPKLTNIALAKTLGVNRDTIADDRKVIMKQLQISTLTETEQLRREMCDRLVALNEELELHRKDGRLPVGVIHEQHLINRSIIELLGVRKPVVEKLEVSKRTVSFTTTIVGTKDGTKSEPKTFTLEQKQLMLKEPGQHNEKP
ncbi:MAG TPA: hypothetical protein VF123_11540 [Candidatus Sulfotelmatobacter sp.]